MPASGSHVTDGDATPDAVVADVPVRVVFVRPKSSDATGGYDVFEPYSNSTAIRMDEGEGYNFDRGEGNLWQRGETVGYTKTVNAGPFTFLKSHRNEPVR